MHVLEAAQQQDRKETEDLLAGFDRPGRSPRRNVPSGDFVDYYARKKDGRAGGVSDPGAGAGAGSPSGDATLRRRGKPDAETVIIPRKRQGPPAWLPWVAAAAIMISLGGAVAYVATADGPQRTDAPSVPSAATTLSSAVPPIATTPSAKLDEVPPPDPVATTTTTVVVDTAPSAPTTAPPAVVQSAAPRASAKRREAATASAATTTTTPSVPPAPSGDPPSNGYIRDFIPKQ